MKNDYKPIKPMKEIPDQLRKLRRQFLRYQQAKKQLELIVQQIAEREDVTEELKATDQMEWVCRMNSIQNRAEEVIKTTLIYR